MCQGGVYRKNSICIKGKAHVKNNVRAKGEYCI